MENVTLSRIPLRYYLDSVTVILTAPSLQMHVLSRAVTEQIVTQSRRLVEFSVSKSGAPNEDIVQKPLNIALLHVF